MRESRPVSSNFDSYLTSASAVLPHPSPYLRGAAIQHPRWEPPLGASPVQARVDTQSGKICRVVDIAEAPWRVILEAGSPACILTSAREDCYDYTARDRTPA